MVGLFGDHGIEPRVLLRTLSFDLAYTPVLQGQAVVIIGESAGSLGLPDELCWLPLSPPARLEVTLVARRTKRSPAVVELLASAAAISDELGWL